MNNQFTQLGIHKKMVKTHFCACALVLGSALKKKMSAGKGLPNGGIEHSVSPMTNGTHCSKSTLNGKHTEANDEELQHVDGHKTGGSTKHLLKEVFIIIHALCAGAGSYKILALRHHRKINKYLIWLHFALLKAPCLMVHYDNTVMHKRIYGLHLLVMPQMIMKTCATLITWPRTRTARCTATLWTSLVRRR